jgi:hypothetical protein
MRRVHDALAARPLLSQKEKKRSCPSDNQTYYVRIYARWCLVQLVPQRAVTIITTGKLLRMVVRCAYACMATGCTDVSSRTQRSRYVRQQQKWI